MLSFVCMPLCTTVVHNKARSDSDYLPSEPPGGISELKFINISLITMIIKKILSISP